jgi:hypothetical protein
MAAIDELSAANKAHFDSIAHQYDDHNYAVKRAEKLATYCTPEECLYIMPNHERPTGLLQQYESSTISTRTQLPLWSTLVAQVR